MAAWEGPVAPPGYGGLQPGLGHVPAAWRPDLAWHAVAAPSLPATAQRERRSVFLGVSGAPHFG